MSEEPNFQGFNVDFAIKDVNHPLAKPFVSKVLALLFGKRENWDSPDTLKITLGDSESHEEALSFQWESKETGETHTNTATTLAATMPCLLHAAPEGLWFQIEEVWHVIPGTEGADKREEGPRIIERNKSLGVTLPPRDIKDIKKDDAFPIHTSEEWNALLHHASDAQYGYNLTTDSQRGALRHHRPKTPFYTELTLSDAERDAGHDVEWLHKATLERDIDDAFIWLYISDQLAPAVPLPFSARSAAWIDLDDVARKALGGYAPNPTEQLRRRAKVYSAICYAARTQIKGERSIIYKDKQTGTLLDTRINTVPWQILERQEATQPSFWPANDVPMAVELVASKRWTELTTSRDTAQFLPFGELLGGIPGAQGAGAWARAVGMAYLRWCRIFPKRALRGEVPPSRRELLDAYPTKVALYSELIDPKHPNGKHPRQIIKHWNGVETILAGEKLGLIKLNDGKPSTTKPAQREGWANTWLDEPPPWMPGPKLAKALEGASENLYESQPRQLNPGKKRGRPKKVSKNH